MAPLGYLILVVISLFGWGMFNRGRRGRRIDDHPICARCKFDLTGRPQSGGRCPECGAHLGPHTTIEIGNRIRRHGLMTAGLCISILAGFPVIAGIGLAVIDVDPIHVEPFWLLLRNANPAREHRYVDEIYSRVQGSRLSSSDDQKVVKQALSLQANLAVYWNPTWGDIVEYLHAKGRVSAADWNTYLSQNEPHVFEVRPMVARGDPIAFHVHGEFRGASPLKKGGNLIEAVTATVRGAVIQTPNYGGGFGSTFDVNGIFPLTPTSWDHLQPGPQSITATFTGFATGIEATPSQFAPIVCPGKWTLLPSNQKSATLYRDESMAALVKLSQSIELTYNGDVSVNHYEITVRIEGDQVPCDLAFDVYLRLGSKEWKSLPGYWILMNRNVGHQFARVSFMNVDELVGHKVDIILRPSFTAAGHSAHLDKLLDHEFVFKDVPIGNQ